MGSCGYCWVALPLPLPPPMVAIDNDVDDDDPILIAAGRNCKVISVMINQIAASNYASVPAPMSLTRAAGAASGC